MSVRKNLGAAFVFAFVFLEACGNAVSPQSDGGRDAMGGDASAGCRLRNGEFCPVGQTCPAGDGCNECSCLAEGNLACTLLACIDAGTPTISCRSGAECADGQECVFSTSSCGGLGECMEVPPCARPETFCSCEGVTYLACIANRPTRHAGACEGVVDAGVSCAGARLNANGACVDSTGAAAPVTCCSGYNCDQRTAACDALPPACPPGTVISVVGLCWGPCVPRERCR